MKRKGELTLTLYKTPFRYRLPVSPPWKRTKTSSNKQQKTEFSALTSEQRKCFLSSETSDIGEEAEVLLDAILAGKREN